MHKNLDRFSHQFLKIVESSGFSNFCDVSKNQFLACLTAQNMYFREHDENLAPQQQYWQDIIHTLDLQLLKVVEIEKALLKLIKFDQLIILSNIFSSTPSKWAVEDLR